MTTMTYLKPKRTLHNRKRKRIYDFPFAQSSQGAQAMIDTDTEWQSRGKQLIVQKVRNRRKQGWWSSFPSVVYSFAELPERLDPLEVIAGNKHPKYCSNTNSGKRIITLHYYLKNLWINHIMQQCWGHLSHIFLHKFLSKNFQFHKAVFSVMKQDNSTALGPNLWLQNNQLLQNNRKHILKVLFPWVKQHPSGSLQFECLLDALQIRPVRQQRWYEREERVETTLTRLVPVSK